MIKAIFFDLDGTLLPMDLDEFVRAYMGGMCRKLAAQGYDPKLLTKTILQGIEAMTNNDGCKTNEAVFWEVFCNTFGQKVMDDIPVINDYYHREFQDLQSVCGFDSRAADTIHAIKSMGYQVILATNPLFPAIATHSRVRWTSLQPDDFAHITTYENSCHCKPNPEYYRDLLEMLNLKAEECLMVGNDAIEDMAAQTLGLKTFLLTDCLINKTNQNIDQWPNGSFPELMKFIQEL